MSIVITEKIAPNKKKIWYHFEWGKEAGQRISTGIYKFTKPKNQIQKNHNKEALDILASKHSQMILDYQSIGTSYIPLHKLKTNFLDYYKDFVKNNKCYGNRHLENNFTTFKKFLHRDYICASDITEELCEKFRSYLLNNLNGETPADYFYRFKRIIKAATKNGYFKINPVEDIKSKARKNFKIKEILNLEEYAKLMKTPCLNHEVKKHSLYHYIPDFVGPG